MNEFIYTVTIVFLAKVKTSGDDLIWLPPFIRQNKLISSFYYLVAINIVVLISWISVDYLKRVITNENYLAFFASIILVVFSITYLRNNENKENDGLTKSKSVFIISLIGSVDELFLFSVLFTTGKYSLLPVILGISFAGLIVILFSFGLNSISWFVNQTEKIKTWLIIFVIGLISMVYALLKIIT